MTSFGYTLRLSEMECKVLESALHLLKEKTESEIAARNEVSEIEREILINCGMDSVYANAILDQIEEQRKGFSGLPRETISPVNRDTTKRKFEHLAGVFVRDTFSDCGKYRYKLTIDGDVPGGKTVCVIMTNPSYARSEYADKTVKFLEILIFQKDCPEFKGVDRMIIVNQFGSVQTSDFIGTEEHIGPENDSYIRDAINESDIVLIAWGRQNDYEERKRVIDDMIALSDKKVLLQTKRHPSRGSYKNFIEPYSLYQGL